MKTKSDIFKAAHRLAKTFEGNYSACLSLALRIVYNSNKGISLAQFIINNMNDSSDWNEKFYQKNNGIVEIYIASRKHDVTKMFNSELNEKGFFMRSEFNSVFNPMLEEMIEKELDSI